MEIKGAEPFDIFIIRIRGALHDKSGQPPELRGEIEHLQSKQIFRFSNLNQVKKLIAPILEETGILWPKQKKWSRAFRNFCHSPLDSKRDE
jgi:hypothetical protein